MRAEAGARSDTPLFLVLLTDGKSQDDAIAAANRLKNAGVEIIAVGETEKERGLGCVTPGLHKTSAGVLWYQATKCEQQIL